MEGNFSRQAGRVRWKNRLAGTEAARPSPSPQPATSGASAPGPDCRPSRKGPARTRRGGIPGTQHWQEFPDRGGGLLCKAMPSPQSVKQLLTLSAQTGADCSPRRIMELNGQPPEPHRRAVTALRRDGRGPRHFGATAGFDRGGQAMTSHKPASALCLGTLHRRRAACPAPGAEFRGPCPGARRVVRCNCAIGDLTVHLAAT
jgi:hypothetical protein